MRRRYPGYAILQGILETSKTERNMFVCTESDLYSTITMHPYTNETCLLLLLITVIIVVLSSHGQTLLQTIKKKRQKTSKFSLNRTGAFVSDYKKASGLMGNRARRR